MILFTLIVTSVYGYIFYQTWFNIDDLHEWTNKFLNKLSFWYPFKQYSLGILQNKKSWIIKTRITNIFGMFFILLYDSLIVIAILYGK